MTRTARALGMSRTTFKNAHGLTQAGHQSTARDMTTLGRHLLYDYPAYYNLFSRRSTDAGVRTVNNTNSRFLNAYAGADGIKTGYTSAAGFNLVASAERGNERIITTVFGGRSTASRNAKVAELMDLGFRRAPTNASLRRPTIPAYSRGDDAPVAAGRTIRLVTAVRTSPRPVPRPVSEPPEELIAAIEDGIENVVEEVAAEPPVVVAAASADISMQRPQPRPQTMTTQATETIAEAPITPIAPAFAPSEGPEIVTRVSSSGGRHYGINVGLYGSRYQAERVLLKTALNELSTLGDALRKVANRSDGWHANFVGMTREGAELACLRLRARDTICTVIGPT